MILSFRTSINGQTVQTQIRLLLEEQSDQCPNFLDFYGMALDQAITVNDTIGNDH